MRLGSNRSCRWGAASSLYYRMAERMNCIQNQMTTRDRVLIRDKVAGFIGVPQAR